jgi:hypothetical protein
MVAESTELIAASTPGTPAAVPEPAAAAIALLANLVLLTRRHDRRRRPAALGR